MYFTLVFKTSASTNIKSTYEVEICVFVKPDDLSSQSNIFISQIKRLKLKSYFPDSSTESSKMTGLQSDQYNTIRVYIALYEYYFYIKFEEKIFLYIFLFLFLNYL